MSASKSESSSSTITYILQNQPANRHNNQLKGKLPNSNHIVEFEQQDFSSDDDIGFVTLGASRKTVSSTLHSLLNNNKKREKLAEEMLNAFDLHHSTNGKQGLAPGLKKFANLFHRRDQAQQDLTILHQTICRTLPDEATQRLTLGELVDWLKMMKRSKEAKDLVDKQTQIKKNQEALLDYCKKEISVFEHYVKSFEKTNLRLGYQSALLYAQYAHNLNLYVWQQDRKTSDLLTLVDYHEASNNTQNVHLLYNGGQFMYFTVLSAKYPQEELQITELDQCRIACVKEGLTTTLQLLLGERYYKDYHLLKEWQESRKNEAWKKILEIRYNRLKNCVVDLAFELQKQGSFPVSDQQFSPPNMLANFTLEEVYANQNLVAVHLNDLYTKINDTIKQKNIKLQSGHLDALRSNFEKIILRDINAVSDLVHLKAYRKYEKAWGTLAKALEHVTDFPVKKHSFSLQSILLELLVGLGEVMAQLNDVKKTLDTLSLSYAVKEEDTCSTYRNDLKILYAKKERLFTNTSLSKVNGDKLQDWALQIGGQVDLSAIRTQEDMGLLEALCVLPTDLHESHQDCASYLTTIYLVYNYKSLLEEALLVLHEKKRNPMLHINRPVFEAIFNTMKEFYVSSYLNLLEFEPSAFESKVLKQTLKYAEKDFGFGRRILNFFLGEKTVNRHVEDAQTTLGALQFSNDVQADEVLMGWIFCMLEGVEGLDALTHPLAGLLKETEKCFKNTLDALPKLTPEGVPLNDCYISPTRTKRVREQQAYEEMRKLVEQQRKEIEEERSRRQQVEAQLESERRCRKPQVKSNATSQPSPAASLIKFRRNSLVSPSTHSKSMVNRRSLMSNDRITMQLKNCVPAHFQLGKSHNEHSFWDSLAQTLNLVSATENCTVETLLRSAETTQHASKALKKLTLGDSLPEDQLPAMIGPSFCAKYNVKLHVFSITDQCFGLANTKNLVVTEQLIDAQGSQSITSKEAIDYNDPTFLHLVIYKNHVVPLVDAMKLTRVSQASSTTNSPDVGPSQINSNFGPN